MTIPTPFLYNATVIYVHDGDTIMVAVDRGMYDYTGSARHPIPVRLAGCAARELTDMGGPEARDNLAAILSADTSVVLGTVKPDKYAPRWRALVGFMLDGYETDLTDLLIMQQWAAPWDGRGLQPKPPWPRTM